MNKKEAKERIETLRKTVEYHAKKYYDDDKPEISDFEYDMLMVELRNLEKEFPEYISEESLTQKVGGHVKEGFVKVEHEVPLQSLQDVFSYEEVEDFYNRIQEKAKENGIEEVKYVVETKIDGLSAALEYKDRNICKRSNKRKWACWRGCNRKFKNNKNNSRADRRKNKHYGSRRSIYI